MAHPLSTRARLHTPKNVKYALVRGPDFTCERHGEQTASVDYQVKATDFRAFVAELMPGPKHIGTKVILEPSWKLPGASYLSPVRVSTKAFVESKPITDPFEEDASAEALTYESDFLVTVDYATTIDSLYDFRRSSEHPEEILERKKNSTVELLSISVNDKVKKQTSLGGDTEQITDFTAPLVRIIPITQLSYRWCWALDPNFNEIIKLLGTVNADDNDDFLDNPPAETTMFTGLSASLEYHHNEAKYAEPVWVMDYSFARKEITERESENGEPQTYGWNHIYIPEDQIFRRVRRKIQGGGTLPLYPQSEFTSELFVSINNEEEEP